MFTRNRGLVEWVVSLYPNPGAINEKRDTLLHLAADSNSFMLARYAMDMGLNPGTRNAHRVSAFDIASFNHFHDMQGLLLTAISDKYLVQLDDSRLLEALPHHASDFAPRLRSAILKYSEDRGPLRLAELSRTLLAMGRPESARILLAGNPCELYQESPGLMQALCQQSHSVEQIVELLEQFPDSEPLLFDMTPLHLAAMLTDQPGQAERFEVLLEKLVSQSRENLYAPDKSGKTVGHYLVDNHQPELLFRWMLHAHDTGESVKSRELYSSLIAYAVAKENLASVSVLQLFWIPVHHFVPVRKRGLSLSELHLSCKKESNAVQVAARKDQEYNRGMPMMDWVRQYHPSGQSPLDQLFSSDRCLNYQQSDYDLESRSLDAASDSRVLTLESDQDFHRLAQLLMNGANPNESYPASRENQHESFIEIVTAKSYGTDSINKLTMAILFGADFKDGHNFDNYLSYSFLNRGSREIFIPYRKALVSTDKSDFSETDKAAKFLESARQLLNQLGLKGQVSAIHPVCSCLSLEKTGADDFTPWCQVKARMPGAEFADRLRNICEDYGSVEL